MVRRLIVDYVEPNVFELFIAFLSITAGISLVVEGYESTRVEAQLSAGVINLWAVALIFGGIFIIAGLTIQRWSLRAGLQVEKSGLIPLCVASMLYGGYILYSFGTIATISAAYIIMFGLSCIARIRVINRYEKAFNSLG